MTLTVSNQTHYEREMGIIQMLPRFGPGQQKVFDVVKAMQRNARRHDRYDIAAKNRTLASEAGVCVRTVQRWKKKAMAAGILIVKEQYRKTAVMGQTVMRQTCDRFSLILTQLRNGAPFVSRVRRAEVKKLFARQRRDSLVTANMRKANERKFELFETKLWEKVNARFDNRRG